MNLQSLDESLEFLNEGKITDAIRNKVAETKIKKWIKDANYVLNNDTIYYSGSKGPEYSTVIKQYCSLAKKYGNTKYFKSHKAETKKLYDKLKENHLNIVKDEYRKSVINFKDEWDDYKIQDIFDGVYLMNCAQHDIKSDILINHFEKSPNMKTYKDMVCLIYDSIKNAEEYNESEYMYDGCQLDDKCIAFCQYDDSVIFYDYSVKKIIELLDFAGVRSKTNDIYKEAGMDYKYFSNMLYDDDIKREVMKEENIKFTV